MSASNWIELAGVVLSLLGAGGVGIGKLTRIAVAAEQLGAKLEQLAGQMGTVTNTVNAHEARIAVLEDHQPPRPVSG